MKTNILKTVLFSALTAGMLTSCVDDSAYGIPKFNCTETSLIANKTVNQVVAASTPTVKQYGDDDVIEAYVTSSDEGGNFYKSISFQSLDGTIGFSVPVDLTSTFISFEPGRKVFVKMKDLYTDISYGSMRIGNLYVGTTGSVSVGRLNQSEFTKAVTKSCKVVNENDIVQNLSISDALKDSNINKLIELSGVQFTGAAIGKNYYDANYSNTIGGATNHVLSDVEGNTIVFRTSSFAKFAYNPVANGSGKVRGVLTKYLSTYQFVARTEDDIKLTNERFSVLLNENFEAGSIGEFTANSVIGNQIWTYSASYGNPGGMVKMSGFAGTNNVNEDWLISPAQNLTSLTGANLTFDNAYKFDGPVIQVLISNNYSGIGNPNAATWTTLTGAVLSTGNYVWANSGLLNINAFVGTGNSKVFVAFKYTSTSSLGSTWEIDNVKINKI